jgi:hypothetical protein
MPSLAKITWGLAWLALLPNVFAQEQLCTELGTACSCSEPLNTNQLASVSGIWLNPADANTKECGVGPTGTVVETNDLSKFKARNDASILSAFPAGHRVNYVLGGKEASGGVMWVGHNFGSATGRKRLAVRWYEYRSAISRGDVADFETEGNGLCENSKFFQINDGTPGTVLNSGFWRGGTTSSYTIYNWTWNNGSQNSGAASASYQNHPVNRGDWVRYELIATNTAGGASPNGLTIKLYYKNVTQNGPETVLWNPTAGDNFIGDTKGAFLNAVTDATPPKAIERLAINLYRQGTCKGYRAISHFMIATWNSDLGQRIDAAYEIEGGLTSSMPPTAPANLRVQ